MPARFPVSPTPGLLLRGLRFAGHLAVSILRLRARIVPSETGQLPSYSFDVPLESDRALVAAYAHPFVADAVTTGPNPSDARVVRPVIAIRGPRSLEVAIPRNDSGDWPHAMDGTITDGPLSKVDHYTQEVPETAPVTSTLTRPQRITHVRNKGADPDNPTSHVILSLLLNSGVSIRVSWPEADLSAAPQAGDVYPADAETDGRVQVGSIGRAQELATPRRNMYSVPVQGDYPAGADPLSEANHPDTVMDVRLVPDLPDNPTTMVKKVTLNSGATVRVPADQDVTVGLPLDNPSLAVEDPEAVDPNEWVEFDVLLIHANYQGQPGVALDGQSDSTALVVVGSEDDTLAGLMHGDPWPIFPTLLQAASESVVVGP